MNPTRMVAFVFDDENICIAVTTGTTYDYIGRDYDHAVGAMYSVLRYEDGSEPQPNMGHSANGYPHLLTLKNDGSLESGFVDGYRRFGDVVDYRALLTKYMALVINEESISYLDRMGEHSDNPKFTDAEVEELIRIEKELR